MDMQSIGINGIREISKYPEEFVPAVTDELFAKIDEPYYRKNRILIGWQWNNKHIPVQYRKKRELWIDASPHKSFICSRSGDGKSWFLKALMSRFYKSGYACFVIDLHDEYSQCKYPLQEKYKEFLPKGKEEPEGLDVFTIRPLFLEKRSAEENKKSVPFQIPFCEMSEHDLIELCGANESYNDIILKHKSSAKTLPELLSIIRSKERAKPVERALENLIKNNVIGEEGKIDIIKELNGGKIVVLNLMGYSSSPTPKYYHVYIKYLLSKIFNARANKVRKYNGEKLEKEIYIFIDEAHSIIPKEDTGIAVEFIIKMIVEGRKFGMSFYFSTQKLKSVNPAAYDQTRYIFTSNNPKNFPDIVEIFKNVQGTYDFHPSFKKKISRMLFNMKNFGKWRCWGYFLDKTDAEDPKLEEFYNFAPLCQHKSSSAD